jgi:geranylgeranyl diphosphate synthase, type II
LRELFSESLSRIETATTFFLEDELARLAKQFNATPLPPGIERLSDALRYALSSGGKKIRPLLTLEVAAACGIEPEIVLPTACAIEWVHTFSLIHDDLPCMDNDDWRRGRATLHKAFDEPTALLAGDALLAMAHGLMLRHTPCPPVKPETLLAVTGQLANVAGLHGLVAGQMLDMQGTIVSSPTLAQVQTIHQHKTGQLLQASITLGAMLSPTPLPKAVLTLLTTWGETLGLLFQVVDDILDATATQETLGKTVGKDVTQGKLTYPLLMGLSEAKTYAQTLKLKADEPLFTLHQQHGLAVSRLLVFNEFITERLY